MMHSISFDSNQGSVLITDLPAEFEIREDNMIDGSILFITVIDSDYLVIPEEIHETVKDGLEILFGNDVQCTYGGWCIYNWNEHRK